MFAIARSHARSARCYHVAPPRSVCRYVVVSKCFLLMRFIGLLRCSNQDFMYGEWKKSCTGLHHHRKYSISLLVTAPAPPSS